MRSVGLSPEIVAAIETYRMVEQSDPRTESDWYGRLAAAAIELADLVVPAYDGWLAEYDTLTAHQRRLLALAWREHRRAQVIEQRGGRPAGRPSISHGREQTMAALRAHGMLDEAGHLTAGGEIVARRAWEQAGASDVQD